MKMIYSVDKVKISAADVAQRKQRREGRAPADNPAGVLLLFLVLLRHHDKDRRGTMRTGFEEVVRVRRIANAAHDLSR